VADTALWVAMYRALETERTDAVFRDPLAGRLAGERGRKMVESTPHSDALAFALVVRTTAIDRLVERAIFLGVDTVINLGAGLDTRPYRMKLPRDLRWIEVDFESTIHHKNNLLAHEIAHCRLHRIAADLSVDTERKKLFTGLGKECKRALIITEGVIAYLTNEQAAQLSKDLFAIPTFRYWIMDYAQGKMRNHKRQKKLAKKLKNAPFRFDVEQPIPFFQQHGWKPEFNIHILDEADRIGRKLPLLFPYDLLMKVFPKKMRAMGNKTYGYMLFSKIGQ